MHGGGVEKYFGAGLLGAGPAGWVVGALMILNGADNLIARGHRAITGEYKQAFFESAIHHYVQNDLAVNLLYMGTQIGLGYVGIRVHRAAIGTAQVAPANRDNLLPVLYDPALDESIKIVIELSERASQSMTPAQRAAFVQHLAE